VKKFAPLFLLLLLVVGLVAGRAFAAPLGYQATVTASAALSGGTAIVNSSSGKRIVVKSMILRASSAGVVTISDGTGGTALGKFYLAQDTPLILDEDLFGAEGLRTTAGNALDASGTNGVTLTSLTRVEYE
jgi:hypothetical protein